MHSNVPTSLRLPRLLNEACAYGDHVYDFLCGQLVECCAESLRHVLTIPREHRAQEIWYSCQASLAVLLAVSLCEPHPPEKHCPPARHLLDFMMSSSDSSVQVAEAGEPPHAKRVLAVSSHREAAK
ncbi:hypothetical protein FIBSPDRAFT_868008 [Athelia psychrophila]|uniref:Uncharacterized protein n=1 Tax=Athelia psychrophila TaxID=1759441 RepID=A0A166DHQ7_9AGAM|nr:hypothetical protein FIBSPDRAFT_868008 [Fibularhizoctonia sp. CBS 109695]